MPRFFSMLGRGYSAEFFMRDLMAGATVGVVALPLAMAFAIASGTTPDKGLVTSIVAGFLISFLGGSRYQIGGPTGAFVVIIYSVLFRHGYDGLVLTTLIAGVLLMILGFCRMGTLIKFIPYPVTTGFTAGIAVIIFSSQMKDFFGLKMGAVPPDFLPKWGAFLSNAGTFDPATVGVGLASLAVILLVRRFSPRIPAPVVAVVLGCLVTGLAGLHVETIGTRFGGIPSSLPGLHMPHITLAAVRAVFPDALTIAMLAGIESLLSCVVADGMTGDRHNSDVELAAQGVANIFSVLFGGIPATGAIARTATNIKAGGQTPVAGMIHAGVLLCFILFLAPVASFIPLASLAAVLIVVAWDMSEFHKFLRLFKAPKSDVMVMCATFLITVLIDLTVAVFTGIVFAAILFMRRMSEVTQITVSNGYAAEDDAAEGGELPHDEFVQTYEIDGPFFFGVADRFRATINAMQRQPMVFILLMDKVPTIDSTGLSALESFIGQCAKSRTEVILAGVKEKTLKRLRKMGTDRVVGAERIVEDYAGARALARALVAERRALEGASA
ncbi:SulP family inorganic anion transporter [Desulfovibrio sp. X2]|uniref:SulP family inorganic anion transporter n=1 Tax=Desulfovibrio sp. X2 TaxID=941449 RepID=UPI001EEDCE12|nr:SulP family inorganic anion transporter [Desulfovibrio sp. X2]